MNNKGSLTLSMLFVAVLSTLSTAVLLSSVNEKKLAERTTNSSEALWAAEAGLQQAVWQYTNNNCQGMVRAGTNTACTSCSCGGDKTMAGTLNGYGDYDITINNANTTIQAVGSIPSRSSASKIQRRVQSTLEIPAIFDKGIFAQGRITLSNNALVDSYNSQNGAYGGANTLSNGNIGTNGTTTGIVTIDNNATVKGSIATGSGGTVTLGNNALVTGTITHDTSVALPAVVVPSSLTSLSSGGTLTVANNGSRTLSAGNYKYSSITLNNNSTLTINGAVKLYLTGSQSLSLANNVNIVVSNGASLTMYVDGRLAVANNTTINTVSHLPSQLQIYSTYTGTNGISISNNGALYSTVYAPLTDITFNNNTGFYGAAVGKTVNLSNNSEVHYDQALATMANPFEQAIATNWQEY